MPGPSPDLSSQQLAPGRAPAGPLATTDDLQLVPTGPEGLAAEPDEAAPVAGPAQGRRRKKAGLTFWLAAVWLLLMLVLAVGSAWLPFVGDPRSSAGQPLNDQPSPDYWLGTNARGLDIFARVADGARVSIGIGVGAVALGLLFGGTLGVLAGFYRGRVDKAISGSMDVMLAFPALVLALSIVSFMGQSTRNVMISLAVLSVPAIARIARANTLVYAQREFVLAARSLGAKNGRLIVKEILPNVIPPMLSFSLIAIAVVIVAEGTLAFLGLGVPLEENSWGSLIYEGQQRLEQFPHISLGPAAIMFLTVLSFNLVGDSLRARFDVKEGAL